MARGHDFWSRIVFDRLKSTEKARSPFHFLLVVTISIFAAEIMVMFFLSLLPPLPVPVEAPLDATLLTVVIFPTLYFCLLRPLTSHIAEREQAEAARRESEERYRQLAENIREVFWICTADLRQIVYVSPEYEQVWGRTRESLYHNPASFLESIYPEDRERITVGLLGQPQDEFIEEYRIVQPRGTVRWVRARAFPVRNALGEIYRIAGLAEDITDRKQTEHKLLTYQEQLQALVSELSLAEERERRRLATDLHDSIAQVLALAKFKLEGLRRGMYITDKTKDLNDVYEFIDQAIQQARSLTFQLSPPVLYQIGLEAAVASLTQHLQEQHGLRIDVTDDGQYKPLTEDMQSLLFRAVQELLINVVKHAQARQAHVAIGRDGTYIRITVVDDGVGFDPSSDVLDGGHTHGFGLFSIHERLHHLRGYCEITSKPGQGTQGTLMAPLRRDAETV